MADWLITEITDRGPGHYYRFHIEGENLNYLIGADGRRFCWSVHDISADRYAPHPEAPESVKAAVMAAKEH